MQHTLVFHTVDFARKIQKATDFKSNPINLSYSQASALSVVSSKENISQQELSVILNLEPASIVALIDELERMKLVTRESANGDRRKYNITLTETGLKKAAVVKKKATTLNNFFKGKLDSEEYLLLSSLLNRLSQDLNNWKGGEK